VGAVAQTGNLAAQALDHVALHVDDGIPGPAIGWCHRLQQRGSLREEVGMAAKVVGHLLFGETTVQLDFAGGQRRQRMVLGILTHGEARIADSRARA
jgi:hypothetical protein